MAKNDKKKKRSKKDDSPESESKATGTPVQPQDGQNDTNNQSAYQFSGVATEEDKRRWLNRADNAPPLIDVNLAEYINKNYARVPVLDEAEIKRLTLQAVNSAPIKLGRRIFVKIDVRIVYIDNTYQRLTDSSVTRLVKPYNVDMTNAVTLSYRDGRFYGLNVIHRGFGAILTGNFEIVAEVFLDMDQAEEARWFADQNKGTTTVKNDQKHRANITGDRVEDITLEQICDIFNMKMTKSQKMPYGLTACKAATAIIENRTLGPECLCWIFEIMFQSKWLDIGGCTTAMWLNAMAGVYKKLKPYPEEFQQEACRNLVMVMRKVEPLKLNAVGLTMNICHERRSAIGALLDDIAMGNITVHKVLQYVPENIANILS